MADRQRKGKVTMHVRSPVAAAHTAVGMESETAGRMAEAATTFLVSLTAEQQGRAFFPLESEERLNWHYIPRERRGLSFKEMDGSQQKFAHALLSSGLSRRGYAKALDIMGLESIVAELEGPARRHPRDPGLYHVTLFGTPSDESPWGWLGYPRVPLQVCECSLLRRTLPDTCWFHWTGRNRHGLLSILLLRRTS